MIKCKNGFTLIELLAIIVILAVIAVITVPIVLGIIDNAKIGAARVSAYGYKDSINKYYVTSLSSDDDFSMDDGVYTADEIKSLGISVSGEEPDSNSWVIVSNNEVSSGCLQFDDYKVDMRNGEVSNASVGSCYNRPIASCPECVFTNSSYTYYFKDTPDKRDDELVLRNYSYDYRDLPSVDPAIDTSKAFLGFILDGDDKIVKAYACGFKDDVPFCIEGTPTGIGDSYNRDLLDGPTLWDNTCITDSYSMTCTYDDMVARSSVNGRAEISITVTEERGFINWSCSTKDLHDGISCQYEYEFY